MKKLVAGCPVLASRPEFRAVNSLRSIDAIAARLWLDRRVPSRFPANVLAGFEGGAGATWFNLNDLQVRTWPRAGPALPHGCRQC